MITLTEALIASAAGYATGKMGNSSDREHG
jgi:hypothetical protein